MEAAQLRSILARNIRAIARDRGIALVRVADFAGVSKSALYAVLRGDQAPTTDWLAKIADVLAVAPADLLAEKKIVRHAAERPRARRKR